MHSSKKDPIILYFIEGSMPNSREMAEIFMLGSNVRVRNGVIAEHTAQGAIETCDGVAGPMIPEAYKGKPDGGEVLYEMRKRIIDELRAQEDGQSQQQQPQQNPTETATEVEYKAAAKAEFEKKLAARDAAPKTNPNAGNAWQPQK